MVKENLYFVKLQQQTIKLNLQHGEIHDWTKSSSESESESQYYDCLQLGKHIKTRI
jgi:hypothetical protein